MRTPLNGTFELTARCNLSCKMCLIRIDCEKMKELGGRERTTNEWIHIAHEVWEAGTLGLLLTGGEPMLRPDFTKIYKTVAGMGFIITLYTNATLITQEIMEVLKEYPPHRIGITVYGASPETYEKVTGNSSAYDKMRNGVEQLKQLPSKLTIRSTIIKDNLKDLEAISAWAFGLGPEVEFNISRIVTKPVRGGIADVESCRLTPEQNVLMLQKRNRECITNPFFQLVKDKPDILKEQAIIDILFNPGEKSIEKQSVPKEKATIYGCEAGINSYTITWDGKLIGCQMLGDCWTEPFDRSFMTAWKEFPSKVKLPHIPEICRDCATACSVCPATRLSETGSLDGWPQYLCREGKLRQEMEDNMIKELWKLVGVKE